MTQRTLFRRALLAAVRRGMSIAVVTVLSSAGLGAGLLVLMIILDAV